MNEMEIISDKHGDKSQNSYISKANVNEMPKVNIVDFKSKRSSYKDSLYRRDGNIYSEQQHKKHIHTHKNSESFPSSSKMIGAISIKSSWRTRRKNLKQLHCDVENPSQINSSFPSTSDPAIHKKKKTSSHSDSGLINDHSTRTSTAHSMVPLVHSHDGQTDIYDQMERLRPTRNLIKIRPDGDGGAPLPGAWLHRGILTPDDDEEIFLDESYTAGKIPPDCHDKTTASPKRYINARNIVLVIITGLGIGFGILKNVSFGSSSSATECSMDSIVEACSTSDNTIEISTCLKERVTRFQQSFAFTFQDVNNNSSTCIPENLAIVSVALQFTDGMSNHSVFQRYGLSLLYFATQGYDWITNENWLSDDAFCDWKNIECSTTTEDDVIGINLGNNNLQGSIPSLFLNYLPSLQYLDLSKNALKCTIPSNLDKLNQVILNDNELTGMLPVSLISSRSIVSLSIQNNNALTLPRQGHFFSGQNWKEIYLGNVMINFTFPRKLHLLPNLEVLDLTKTDLKGEIPSGIGLLSRLLKFTASFNSLTGQLPTELGGMKSLKEIDISHNELNGTIPSQIGFLANLEKFRINDNFMVSNLPWELSKNSKLTELVVSENKLSGTMPSELGRLSNLNSFLFSSNFFTGEIPLEVCNLKNSMSLFGEEVMTECPDFGALKCPEALPSCCCDSF